MCAVVLCTALGPLLAQQISSRRSRAAREAGSVEPVREGAAEWFFRQRASANGHIPNSLLLEAFAGNRKMISANGTFVERAASLKQDISPSLHSWTSLGPQPTANTAFYGNVSGRVTALAPDPCDTTGNTVYAGGADGGVWVSFNASLSGNRSHVAAAQPDGSRRFHWRAGVGLQAVRKRQMAHAQSSLIWWIRANRTTRTTVYMAQERCVPPMAAKPGPRIHVYEQRIARARGERPLHLAALAVQPHQT